MTYLSEITKIEMLPFAELFKFTSGQRKFYYTSADGNFDFGGNTYIAVPIKRTTPSFDESLKAFRVKVTAPLIAPVNEYLANTPIEATDVEITRVFLHDITAFKVFFCGQILGVTLFQGTSVIDCESESTILRNKLPRIIHQAFCNNTLYMASENSRPDCNLDKELFKATAIITLLGNDLDSATFATFPAGYFIGGYVETSYGDLRLITSHTGSSSITLNVAFDSRLSSGDTVFAYPGCDKAPLTCGDKFSNFPNFQGFAYIPNNNPVIWGFK